MTLFSILLIIIQPGSQQVVANQLNLPQRNFVGFEINADAGNDIIIGSSQEYGILDSEFLLQSGSAGEVLTLGDNRVDLFTGPGSSPFELSDNLAISHFVNDTADDLILGFQTQFFDLLYLNGEDLNETNLIENVLLYDQEHYGLKFYVPEDEVMQPLVFSANAETSMDAFDLRTMLLTPSGSRQDATFELSPFEDELLPFVPFESGEYTLFLEPMDGDLVLGHFAILNDFPVEDIAVGSVKTLQGTRADVDFYRPLILNGRDTGPGSTTDIPEEFSTDTYGVDPTQDTFVDLRVDGFVNQNNIIQDLNLPNDLLGRAEIRVHTPEFPFGTMIPYRTLFNSDTIISTTVTPPDDDNPSVKAEKEKLGMEEGYDLEVGFWFEMSDVPELPIAEDILLNNGNSDWFTFTLNDTMIVGLNDSSTSEFAGSVQTFAAFTNLLTGEVYFIDARANDISNFNDVYLQILPAGNYSVKVESPPSSFAQFSLFEYRVLELGSNSVTQRIGENTFFSLPSDGFIVDFLNFTANDLANMSSFFDIFIYDSSGEQLNNADFAFENYGNLLNSTFVKSINDSIIGGVNTRGAYLQVRNTANTLWNASQLVPGIIESDADVSTTLNIDRVSYLEILQLNPNEDHQICGYSDFSETTLNGTLNQIVRYCDYESFGGGNRLLISGINMSMSVEVFVDGSNQWFNTASSSKTIDGVTEYSVIIEFATAEPLDLIVIMRFNADDNGLGFNNSISVTLQTTEITYLPPIVLRTLSLTGIGSDGDIPETITTAGAGTNPFSVGTSVVATGAITAVALGAFYAVQVKGFRPKNPFRRKL